MSGVARIAARARARAAARVAEAVRAAAPHAHIEARDDSVAIEGRGLRGDAPLRWIAGLLR